MADYDDDNIFAKVLRGEIPSDKIYEDIHVMAFRDINPQAAVHALIVPKGQYTDMSDFSRNASDSEVLGFTRAIDKIAEYLGVDKTGYRLVSNMGEDGNQEISHFHIHILGGQSMKKILPDD